MTPAANFVQAERHRASAWKQATTTLPPAAKHRAPYVGKSGSAGSRDFEFCLPAEFAEFSLLPEVRHLALALFAELGIPWHAGVGGGPGNHLLSSQVQCVNALGQMVLDPDRIVRAFGPLLGTVEVEQIEPGRWLTFEYIGGEDHLNEAASGKRIRGAHCTSVDAAFVHRTSDGVRELVLVEWKYTERYPKRRPDPPRDAVRFKRYSDLLAAADGPVIDGVLPFDELLQEPLYQLMRQQLLAHELEKAHAHGFDRVRVVHVMPAGNQAYGASLHGEHARQLGSTVKEVWSKLLRRSDRFVPLDSAVFLDPAITSQHYVHRYGDTDPAHTSGRNAEGRSEGSTDGEWVDRSVLEAASWRLASELVRRHPTTTRIFRLHPGGGQYDCLTIRSPDGEGGRVHLNRHGTIQIHHRFDGRPAEGWDATEWDEYLRSDPREFLGRLERASGLTAPSKVPVATPRTLTYRVLAAIAATAVKSVRPIDIQSGFIDSSSGSGPNTALDPFASIPAELRRASDADVLGEAGYRFWVVVRDDIPILAVEQDTATAWTRHDSGGVDLVASYRRSGCNLVAVALDLLRAADNL